ncbi:MAG: aminoglycoside 6-adenylyltransferase [Candidatus Izemoplasmatales bacterium]
MTFLDRILSFAKNYDLVRLVVMNGSRVNSNITPDKFQDYDLVFYVNNYKDFIKDVTFIYSLGEVLVKQTSLDQRDGFEGIDESFIYMLQYKDGNKLDLTVRDVSYFEMDFKEDSLSKILLDKEGLNFRNNPNESSYYVKPIDNKSFYFSVNEFYWVCLYVFKGIARDNLFYAIKHLNIIREELENIIDWWIGEKHNYKIAVGKGKSRYKDLLNNNLFEMYKNTYPGLEKKSLWDSTICAIKLFDLLANHLAIMHNYDYPTTIKEDIIDFINKNYSIN